MSWHAECIVNTVEISDEVGAELYRRFNYENPAMEGEGVYAWEEYGALDSESCAVDGKLVFGGDEGVDYLWSTPGLMDAMIELGCRGRICFGDVEGGGGSDFGGRFWGYDFTDSGVVELKGSIAWRKVKPLSTPPTPATPPPSSPT